MKCKGATHLQGGELADNSTVQEANEESECGERFVARYSTSLRRSTEMSAQRSLCLTWVCTYFKHCTVGVEMLHADRFHGIASQLT